MLNFSIPLIRWSIIISFKYRIFYTPLSKIDDRLDELESRVAGYSEKVETIQDSLSNFKVSIQRWFTLLALFITLLLLWLAFSQVGLFVLARRWYISQGQLADASVNSDSTYPEDDDEEDVEAEAKEEDIENVY